MSFFANASTSATAEKDIEVADPPTDSISSLAFSPQADYLAVGSWDNNVSGAVFFLLSILGALWS
jgi:mRNA export factor